jgi:hypothetical protein
LFKTSKVELSHLVSSLLLLTIKKERMMKKENKIADAIAYLIRIRRLESIIKKIRK